MSKDNEYYKLAQQRWYAKQKPKVGYIYRIVCKTTGDCYVGSTTNSLRKRFWQAKSSPRGALKVAMDQYGKDDFYIEELEELLDIQDRLVAEQKWIELLSPELNKNGAIKQPREVLGCYKGGIWVQEKWYPTLHAAWEAVGQVAEGTMKSRYYKTGDIEFAMGLKEENY